MKKNIMLLTNIFLLTVIFFPGCQQKPQETIENPGGIVQITKADFLAEFHKLKEDVNLQIEANDKVIKELKDNIRSVEPKLKVKYANRITGFEYKNRDIKQRLDDYRDYDISRWSDFKLEIVAELDELREALKSFSIQSCNIQILNHQER